MFTKWARQTFEMQQLFWCNNLGLCSQFQKCYWQSFVCKDRAISQQPTLNNFLLLLIKVYYQNHTKKAPFSVVHNLIYCYFTTCPIFTKTSVIFSLAKNCQKADNYFNRYSISPLPGVLYNTFPKHSSEIYQDVYKKVTCRCWN